MTELQSELAELIVDSLELDDVRPDAIDPVAPLFGEGLALDSIDALELAVALTKKYGVVIQQEDDETKRIFSSLANLTGFVAENRVR